MGGVGWKSEFNVSSRPLPGAMSHWTVDWDRGLALDNNFILIGIQMAAITSNNHIIHWFLCWTCYNSSQPNWRAVAF